jgi:mannan endo-1,4-beta-mannosidase
MRQQRARKYYTKTDIKCRKEFLHQDDLAYGWVNWKYKTKRSDVKDTGDYPAVYGWDLGGLEKKATCVVFLLTKMGQFIKDNHTRGGVSTKVGI